MSGLGIALALMEALRVPGPLSPRNASYQISASLDAEHKTVSGKERLTWRNTTRGAAAQLVFHLYMNAFKNESSAFYRESHGHHRLFNAYPHGWGAIDITRLVVGGVDLTAGVRVDDTLATVALPAPLAAGATAQIDI